MLVGFVHTACVALAAFVASGSGQGCVRASSGECLPPTTPRVGSGVVLMQRAHVRTKTQTVLETSLGGNQSYIDGPSEEELLLQQATDIGDYDCDGDGVLDCGRWNYSMAMCSNQPMCGHHYKFPDATLDHSCRCRRCAASPRTAQGDPHFKNPDGAHAPFKALPWGVFRNWADHMNTCAPWIMPKSDEDLSSVLSYARQRGYKVRISGAGHSAGGIVTDGRDENTVVVSLAEYFAPGDYEFSLRDMPDGSKRAFVNAGWTQFHLYERVRPLGFFLPAQTAGYFFALGGIVANSVHGGSYRAGFVHSYATRLRVMSFDGSVKIVDTEEEMRYWRCSFGLLGIILSVELQLEHRDQLQMYSVSKKLPAWNAEEFWTFIKKEAEADLPAEVVPRAGGAGSRKSWNGEYFVDFLNGGETPEITVYAQKANESVDANFGGQLDVPKDVHEAYARIKNERVSDEYHGRMSWGEAARRDGAPPIRILGMTVNTIVRGLRSRALAHILSREAMTNVPRLARQLSQKVNDGFFLTQSPAALAGAYFVEPAKAFAAMDFLRKVQLESRGSTEFIWNLPGEFRFVNVQDSAVLQPVTPGVWFAAEMISFPDMARNHQSWKRDFKRVADFWVKELKAQPHLGKLFGFGTRPDGSVEPFSDGYSCTIYSDAQKDAFEAFRAREDPEGLFAAGLGMKFLQRC